MTDRVDLEAIKAGNAKVRALFPGAGVLGQVLDTSDALVAELVVLRAQRDAALAALDAAVAEQDKIAAEATMWDADSPAAASMRGRAGGVYLAAELVRSALGVQPEGSSNE